MAYVIDPNDTTWLPPHTPSDIWEWDMHSRNIGRGFDGFVQVHGTKAYEFICLPDGRATEIKVYIDGECTHHWRRDPIDGVWPGSYEWKAVAIYGKGLVGE